MTTSTATARPRVADDRAAQILAVVVDLLIEVGYDRLTLDAVAERAHTSKATLYRHWNGKPDLVVDAVALRLEGEPARLPDTGSLRGDLVAKVCRPSDLAGDLPVVLTAVLPALSRDPALLEAARSRFLEPKQQRSQLIFERARERGEIGPEVDLTLVSGILPSLAMYATVIEQRMLDDDTLTRFVDEIVLPACGVRV